MDSGQSSCPWLERVLLKGFDGNLYILPMAKSEQLRYDGTGPSKRYFVYFAYGKI